MQRKSLTAACRLCRPWSGVPPTPGIPINKDFSSKHPRGSQWLVPTGMYPLPATAPLQKETAADPKEASCARLNSHDRQAKRYLLTQRPQKIILSHFWIKI